MTVIETGNDPVVRVAGRGAVAVGYVAPAATFTATTPTSASAGTKTKLTSAGAHGLTAAVALNKTIYISAGTGWTPGFYNISAITLDTTGVDITIDVAFDAGFGSPTIALAGTEVTFATVSIPVLYANSIIRVDASWSHPNNANSKTPKVKLGATTFYGPTATTTANTRPAPIVIQNRNSTSSQVSASNSGLAAQSGSGGSANTTGSIDTSVATSLTITGTAATANDYIYLERYLVEIIK